MEQEIIYKSKGRRGTRSIRQCKNCNKSFSELNLKINAGGGKFCSDKCYKEYRKKNKKDTKLSNRLYQKKHRYNLTPEEYNNLFQIQNNRCAICNKEFNENLKAYVDHNHSTNKIRGLLCSKCNSLLGFADDDIEILQNAIKYLTNN